MDIWKVNKFNFFNEEVEEFTSRWSPTWLMWEALVSRSKKTLNIVYET